MATMRNLLLTGFEPFDGDTLNPAGEIAQALHGSELGGHLVHGVVLPCRFGAARDALRAALQSTQPALVLALGQAARAEISVERVAINVDDARIPDNGGAQPIDTPVEAQGPAAYFSTLPIKAIVRTLQRAGLPAQVSQTAGTFVCNHVFYALMHELARHEPAHSGPAARGGFIHVPLLPQQALARGGFGLPLALQLGAVRLALLKALRRPQQDLHETGGAID